MMSPLISHHFSQMEGQSIAPKSIMRQVDDKEIDELLAVGGDNLQALIAMILNSNIKLQNQRQREQSKRRERNPWDEKDVKKLLVGVYVCGVGKWSRICRTLKFEKRSYTDLKDKWRNLLDPRENSRTHINLKRVANFINEGNFGHNACKADECMIEKSWESVYEQLAHCVLGDEKLHSENVEKTDIQCTFEYGLGSDDLNCTQISDEFSLCEE